MKSLSFLLARANGQVPTGAAFLRGFVRAHPEYKKDSKLDAKVKYDLLSVASKLGEPGNPA